MVLQTPLLLHWSPSSRFCLLWIQPFVLPFLERKAQRAGGEHLPGQTICLGILAREEGEEKRKERRNEKGSMLIKSTVDEWRGGDILGLVQRSEVTALLNGCIYWDHSIPPLSAAVVLCFSPQACVFLGMGTKDRTPTGRWRSALPSN